MPMMVQPVVSFGQQTAQRQVLQRLQIYMGRPVAQVLPNLPHIMVSYIFKAAIAWMGPKYG